MNPRDVLRIYSRTTKPPKYKRFICVCPHRRFFLQLNSKALWPPHHALFAVNNDFLEHDSYVELTRLYCLLEEDCRLAEPLGRVSPNEIGQIYASLDYHGTLPPAHMELVRESWVV